MKNHETIPHQMKNSRMNLTQKEIITKNLILDENQRTTGFKLFHNVHIIPCQILPYLLQAVSIICSTVPVTDLSLILSFGVRFFLFVADSQKYKSHKIDNTYP